MDPAALLRQVPLGAGPANLHVLAQFQLISCAPILERLTTQQLWGLASCTAGRRRECCLFSAVCVSTPALTDTLSSVAQQVVSQAAR